MTKCADCKNEAAAWWCHTCLRPIGHNCRAAEHAAHITTAGVPAPKTDKKTDEEKKP